MLLRELSPQAVALDACEAVLEHLYRVVFRLNPYVVTLPRSVDLVTGSELGLTVQRLTEYAQRGCPVGDWTDDEMAADGLLSVVHALYGGPLDHHGATPGILSEGEPETSLETVILGAWTRIQLARREPIEARQIAVLASCPTRTVRHHIDVGDLAGGEGRPARVPPGAVRAYLAARGVRG
jgi:hypothetical protein